MTEQTIYDRLVEKIDKSRIFKNVPMKEHTSFKVGGCCDIMVMPYTQEEIQTAVGICREAGTPFFVLGKGTNLIVKDEGYHGVIIKLGSGYNHIKIEGEKITAQAGVLMSNLSKKALEHGLMGLEFASGIPGSIGGAVIMNAGAYDGEIGNLVQSVRYMNSRGDILEIEGAACDFAYRHSVFQDSDKVILQVVLMLKRGDVAQIQEKISRFTKMRNEKQPLSYPSAGSTFKRPAGYYAGKLIQDAGLMGLSVGGAKVSDLHAGFIINENNASAKDILDLIELVRQIVYDRFGIMLESEVKIL